MSTRVAVVGATGRMGRLVSRLVEDADDLQLVARLASHSPLEEMLEGDVVVDVTLPHVSPTVVGFAVEHGRKVLVGTSGWSAERIAPLAAQVERQPQAGVVIIPNFALGSVLATRFAATAARFYDSIEIVETHGTGKVDSPSGTAVRTAELIGEARAALGPVLAPHADQRARGQQVASVPIHSLRMHGVSARQEVVVGGTGETLRIVHDASSDTAYERGILLALRATVGAGGVTVGLDALLDLDALPS